MIKSYWHVSENFGDVLTPYLIKKISGQDAQYVEHNSKPSPFMVTGSILGCGITHGIIWGTGSAFQSDLDPDCFNRPSEDFKIIATRGALSKSLVEQSGHKPVTFGDPGILLPRFYTSNIEKKYSVGIICSWVDYDELLKQYDSHKISIINSQGSAESVVENTIDKICECEVIVASTLHGLVTAVAYRIPTISVKFSDKMVGDGFKYQDFLTCTENPYQQIDLRNRVSTTDELKKLTFLHKLTINPDDLLDCCPFRQGSSFDSSL